MNYRRLGRSGLKVSPLCLGTMMFGDQAGGEVARWIIASARDAGVNFIDTADVYAAGESERIVGAAIKPDRDRWVLATKAGFMADPLQPSGPDLSRKSLTRACEQSLRRLGTDYIDLYYLHRDDPTTDLEEIVHVLADLLRMGRIHYIGASNFSAWRMAEFVRLCDEAGIDRPAACQPQYNAMNRMPEAELFPACQYYGVGVVPFSPLARGVLTGKYGGVDQLPEGSRAARKDKRLLETEFRDESIAGARSIVEYAQARGTTAASFALRWVLNSASVASVICGPRTLEQWEANLQALLEPPITYADEAFVNNLVRPGHPSTPGYTDPAFPVTGRQPRSAQS